MLVEFLIIATLSAAELEVVRHEVLCAEVRFSRAVENRDFGDFLASLDPEARFVTGQVSRGPDEIGQGWAGFFKTDGPRIRWRPLIVEVVANGTLAISRGPYRMTTIDENGDPVQVWGTFNSTWRLNAQGEWKVLFDAGGDHGMSPSATDIETLNSEPDCD
jgi:ketosteroid isomerase-like protein